MVRPRGVPRLLVLDTANRRCAVGLMVAGQKTVDLTEEMQRGHAERLFPMIEEALASAEIAYGDLECIAVAAGPGSFTGIRIGIAAARGMALALGIPAVGVSVLEALAEEAGWSHRGSIVAVNLGPRGTVYWQCFRTESEGGPRALSEPAWKDADAIVRDAIPPDSLCVGSGALPLSRRFGVRAMTGEYPDLAAIGVAALRRGQDAHRRPVPVYVRPPDARPRS